MKAKDPGTQMIGVVTNLNGTKVEVWVSDNVVTTTGPLMLLGAQFVELLHYLAVAGWKAAVNEGTASTEDGGEVTVRAQLTRRREI